MLFDNRTETQNISNTDFIILNTGSSRHRGLEGELSYDFLARFQHPPVPEMQPEPGKEVVDSSKGTPVPGISPKDYHPYKLIAFSNVQFLDAEFTESALLIPDTRQNNRRQYAGIRAGLFVEGRDFVSKRTLFRHSLNSCLRVTAILAGHEYWEPDNPESQNSCLQDFQSFGGLVSHQESALDRRHLEPDRRKILRSRVRQRHRARTASFRLRRSIPGILTGPGAGENNGS